MSSVLIADDDAHIARVLAIWLGRHGYHVVSVANGVEALNVVRRTTVSLLVTDMNMPELNGVELVHEVREKCGLTMPIFMLTARCDRERLASDLKGYDVRIFSKPFLPSELLVAVREALSTSCV